MMSINVQRKSVAYGCKLISEGKDYYYIGSTENYINYIKRKITNQENTSRDRRKDASTSLSKLI